jgi:HEAT repeat protein
MLIVSGARGAGKSTRLLTIVRDFFPTPDMMDRMLIVTPYPQQRRELSKLLQADERWATSNRAGEIMNNVVSAASFDDLVQLRQRLQGFQPRQVFIDNLDTLVQGMFWPHRVELATITGTSVHLSPRSV